MSKKQRVVSGIVVFLAVSAIVGFCEGQRVIEGGSTLSDPEDAFKPRLLAEQPVAPESTKKKAETPVAAESTREGDTPPVKKETKAPEVVPPTPPPPDPPRHMNIAGRWSDELTGTGIAVTYVDVGQQGQDISGFIYNLQGYQVGTFSGRVNGTSMEYGYVAASGVTGAGRGQLRADGIHIDVQVQEHLTGSWERHTLHKGHWPPQ